MFVIVLMLCVSIVGLFIASVGAVVDENPMFIPTVGLAWISIILCAGFLKSLYAQSRTRKNMEKMINLLDTIAKQNKKD